MVETKPEKQIIVALDTPSLRTASRLVSELKGVISFYKVGFELFTAHGWKAVDMVRQSGARIFLDLKLHDIPNTVAKAMTVLCVHDVDMVTVHTLGGREMMKRVRETVDAHVSAGKTRPKVLGVTILTSHAENELKDDLGIPASIEDEVSRLARLAHESGLDGIVSSPLETARLRKELPRDFLMVTPGVRPAGSDKKDQQRTFTPAEALNVGADFLVIGRPITEAQKPLQMVESILDSLNK